MKTKPRVCFVLTVTGSSDDYLINGAQILLRSLRISNEKIPVLILYDDLSASQLALFGGYELRKVDLTNYSMSLDSTLNRPDLNSSVFLRFEIQEVVDFDIAVYLDCDVVVLDNIDEIFGYPGNISAREMAAYPVSSQFASAEEILQRVNPEFNSSGQGALNAGILKFETEFLRAVNLKGQVLEFLQEYGSDEFNHNDQSLINLFYCMKPDAFSKLPWEMNFMMYPDMLEGNHEVRLNSHNLYAPFRNGNFAKVVHWTGPAKPWNLVFRSYTAQERELFCEKCYSQFTGFSKYAV